MQCLVAATGDKQRSAELFVETIEMKGIGRLASIVLRAVVKDVKPLTQRT
jgi:hypothetical protein